MPSNIPSPSNKHIYAKLSLGLFVTCLLVYAIFWSGHHYSIDGVVYFQYAKVLLFHHTLSMDPLLHWGVDIPSGRWPIGLSLAYLPVLAVLSSTVFQGNDEITRIPYNPALEYDPAVLANPSYLYSSFLNPAITAFTAVILFFVCVRLGFSIKRACAATFAFGLVSPAAIYAKSDFAQPLASLLLLLTFFFVLDARDRGRSRLVIAGVFLGAAILARPEIIISPAPVIVGTAYFIRRNANSDRPLISLKYIPDLLALSVPVLAFVIFNQYLNFLRTGSWLSVGYNPVVEFTADPSAIGTALVGNLISPGRGILMFFPLGVLALAGIRRLVRQDRLIGCVLILVIISDLLLFAAWKDWTGGVSWGPRFFIPLMPYLTILAFMGYDSLTRVAGWLRRSLFIGLTAVGVLITLQGLLLNYKGYYRDAWISPLRATWSDMFDPTHFDIYWLQNMDSSQGITLWILLSGVALLCLIGKLWIDFFRRNEAIPVLNKTV